MSVTMLYEKVYLYLLDPVVSMAQLYTAGDTAGR